MKSVSASLPYPPSANRIWRMWKGRAIKSEAYRDWLNAAQAAVDMGQRGKIRGQHSLSITAHRPDNRVRDLDNLLKPTLDAIKDTKFLKGLIRDDADTKEITIRWADSAPNKDARIIVEVTEIHA